ncbi:MAG: GAF domain-containing protein [Chloroflexi bacterium]|nr:GAF domain-containing protein [Chloroflexota bacterium]
MQKDNELESQLDGLFSDAHADTDVEQEIASEETDPRTEQKIIDMLEGETEPAVAESMPVGPPMLETESAALPFAQDEAKEDQLETQEPDLVPMDFLTWENKLQAQRIRTMNIMLGSLAGLGTVIIAILLIINLIQRSGWTIQNNIHYFTAYLVLLILTVARRLDPVVRAITLIVLTYCVGIAAILMEGPLSAGGLYLLAAPLLAAMLTRQWVGAVTTVTSCLLYTGFLLADYSGVLNPTIPYDSTVLPSIFSLSATFALISACMMFMQWMFHLTLTSALREARKQHDDSINSRTLLETRANELGQANALLQKRALQLETAAQIASTATYSVIAPQALMQQVVDMIQGRFGLYYVGLFLADDDSTADSDDDVANGDDSAATDVQRVRLYAGTGEAGLQMLAMDYTIQVDTTSTIGQCILKAEAYIAQGVGSIHLASSSQHVKAARLLPDTRSEMSLPLRSRGRVFGALVLRSTERDAFSEQDIPVLQTMADQVAVAIDNARLYDESQARLKEMEQVQRSQIRERWTDYMTAYGTPAYERTQPDVKPLDDTVLPQVQQALAQRERVLKTHTDNNTEQASLIVPISLRDEAIGVLGLQGAKDGQQWTEAEITLIEAIADQLALAIENARLLEETQQRAERERIIANITTRVRASMDPETILQTAVRELGAALGTDRAFVTLGAGQNTGNDESTQS